MLQACIATWTVQAGLVTQTVTSVVDHDGNPFIPKLFIPLGNSALATLEQYWRWTIGYDDLTNRASEAGDQNNAFGLKDASGAVSGDYSVLDLASTFFFGGVIQRLGLITGVRSGEFDVRYDLNNRSGDTMAAICLGGDTFAFAAGGMNNSTVTLGFDVQALLGLPIAGFGGGSATGGSANPVAFGWATPAGEYGTATAIASGITNNARYQRSDKFYARLSGTAAVNETDVASWGTNSFRLSSTLNGNLYVALGGCLAKAGVETQRALPGAQKIITGLSNRLVLLLAIGKTAGTGIDTTNGQLCLGVLDGTRQFSYWGGERATGAGTLYGARYLSKSSVLRFGTPNGGGTVFDDVATSGGFDEQDASFSVNWAEGGDDVSWLWLALGDVWVPPPPPVPPGCLTGLPLSAVTGRGGCIDGLG